MKIAFISTHITKEKKHGIGRYVFNILKEISKANHEIYLIDYERKEYLNKYCKKQIIIENKWPYFKFVLWNLFLLRKISKLKEKFDIVFNPCFVLNYFGEIKNFFPVVYDLIPLKYKERRFLEFILCKFLYKNVLEKSKKIITLSEYSKKDIVEYFKIDPQKIKVIYGAVDKRFKIIESKRKLERIQKKYNLPRKFVLTVNFAHPRKNTKNLLEAYSKFFKMINVPLVIIGEKEWGYERVINLWKKLKLGEKVRFIFSVPDEDLVAIYNLAEVFIYPSFYEGFGLPVIEAMACGCPVITSNLSSLPEVGGKAAFYVNPYSVKDIAGALEKVLRNKNLRKKMIREGRKQAKRFSWENSVKELLKIFKEV